MAKAKAKAKPPAPLASRRRLPPMHLPSLLPEGEVEGPVQVAAALAAVEEERVKGEAEGPVQVAEGPVQVAAALAAAEEERAKEEEEGGRARGRGKAAEPPVLLRRLVTRGPRPRLCRQWRLRLLLPLRQCRCCEFRFVADMWDTIGVRCGIIALFRVQLWKLLVVGEGGFSCVTV